MIFHGIWLWTTRRGTGWWSTRLLFCQRNIMEGRPNDAVVPPRSQPGGLPMAASTVGRQDVGVKYATGVTKNTKIRLREKSRQEPGI